MDAELFIQCKQFIEPIVEAIDRNTEKVQELLERAECIDNTFDDLRDQRGAQEQADADFKENILEWLRRIHQQGQP